MNRALFIGLPLLASLLSAMLLTGGSSAQETPKLPPLAVSKLREKINPEYAAWSPEQTYERVAEHLAVYQGQIIAASGARTKEELEKAREYAAKESSYLVYFDLSDVPRQLLPAGTASLQFTNNSSSSAPIVYRALPVANCDNRLFFADYRYLNWSDKVLEKISEEDPYYRNPIIPSDSKAFQFVRATVGNKVIRASWFCYYTGDTTEFLKKGETKADNAFYYQLLYASNFSEKEVEKTVEKEVEKVQTYTEYEQRQVLVDYGNYRQYEYRSFPVQRKRTVKSTEKVKVKVKEKVFGAVPQNAKEFQKFWRIDSALKDAADFFADRGAVIDEDRSQVSYSNRVIQRVRTNLGTYTRTFDVFRTSGDQDFLETLPVPLQDKKKFKFDAGEHIFQDPKGNQIYLLTAGDNEDRVEFGDPRVVRDQMSGHRLIVSTWKSCVACHDKGMILLQNEVETVLKAGAKLNVRYDQFFAKNAFYLRNVNRLLEIDNLEYAEFVRECNGLTPPENARQFQSFRSWYISPVTLEQAARECGAPVEELMDAIQVSPKIRIARLLTDKRPMPRYVWERGGFQETFLLLIEYRKAVNEDRGKRGLPPVSLTTYTAPPPLKRDK
jgi:hypothetical protein